MHQPTIPISTSSAWGKQQVTPNYTPIYMGDKPSISQTKSIISTRLSDKQFRTISSGHRIASPYPAKGTTSFTAIHKEIVGQNSGTSYIAPTYTIASSNEEGSGRGEKPGGNAVGDNTVPVGDMLLPLLAMVATYIIIKLFRNRKTSHTL